MRPGNRKVDVLVFLAILGIGLFVAARAQSAPVRWNTSVASVYNGIGLGGVTACHGEKPPKWWRSNPTVAHKTLPCGTKVRLLYRGRKITARVWDRGPYVGGRDFDLDVTVQRRLGFPWGVDAVRWRLIR